MVELRFKSKLSECRAGGPSGCTNHTASLRTRLIHICEREDELTNIIMYLVVSSSGTFFFPKEENVDLLFLQITE